MKIFERSEEASWYREAEFYQTVLLRHDHVLGFIAADIRSIENEAKLLLITEYHKYGSLYDFLQNFTFDYRILLRLSYTTVSGLSYLHREIYGTKGKPPIAHRDVKSRNILVKSNFTCAIGDLGLAVRLNPDTKELDIAKTSRKPSTRYASPEVLENSLDETHFDAYRMADMYSFALVLWEIARRCQTQGIILNIHISVFQDILHIVCLNRFLLLSRKPYLDKDQSIMLMASQEYFRIPSISNNNFLLL